MEFYIGQIFEGTYPPEAAAWCNGNGAHIEAGEGVYTIVENPPPPETKTVRTFSKFSIWVATYQMPLTLEDGTETTVWAAFEKFLNDVGLWTGWLQLIDLVEDNPFFEAFYPQAVEAFGKELVDQVLAASVTSTKEVIVEVTPEVPEETETLENGNSGENGTGEDAGAGESTPEEEPPAETPENGTDAEVTEPETPEQTE